MKKYYSILLLASVLILAGCKSKDQFHAVEVNDKAGLLSESTTLFLKNYKRAANIRTVVATERSIPPSRMVLYADSLFKVHKKADAGFAANGFLIVASRSPAVVQLRVGTAFQSVAENLLLYPGYIYYSTQERTASVGIDRTVLEMLDITDRIVRLKGEEKWLKKLNGNSASNSIGEAMMFFFTPRDNFWFNTFLKPSYHTGINMLSWTGSLPATLILIFVLTVLILFAGKGLIRRLTIKRKRLGPVIAVGVLSLAARYTLIFAAMYAVLFIGVPSMENQTVMASSGFFDTGWLSSVYATYLTGSSFWLGLLFLVLIAMYTLYSDSDSMSYCWLTNEYQQAILKEKGENSEKISRGIEAAMDGYNGTEIINAKDHPYANFLSTSVFRTFQTVAALLFVALFLMNKSLLILFCIVIFNWFASKMFFIISELRLIKKHQPQALAVKNAIAIVAFTPLLVLALISAAAFPFKGKKELTHLQKEAYVPGYFVDAAMVEGDYAGTLDGKAQDTVVTIGLADPEKHEYTIADKSSKRILSRFVVNPASLSVEVPSIGTGSFHVDGDGVRSIEFVAGGATFILEKL